MFFNPVQLGLLEKSSHLNTINTVCWFICLEVVYNCDKWQRLGQRVYGKMKHPIVTLRVKGKTII